MIERETGTVKWYDTAKGYGFIIRENGNDIFVHYSTVRNNNFPVLKKGQVVEFTTAQSRHRLQAQDVVVLS